MTKPDTRDLQTVAAPSQMPSDNFRRHMAMRHAEGLAPGQTDIPAKNFTFEIEQSYRAAHRAMHRRAARGEIKLNHVHQHEPDSAMVLYALQCLLENRLWGWREIAGYPNKHVSAFPNGAYATRVRGVIRHHKSAMDASRRLMGYQK